jgi:hypothetical protein
MGITFLQSIRKDLVWHPLNFFQFLKYPFEEGAGFYSWKIVILSVVTNEFNGAIGLQ